MSEKHQLRIKQGQVTTLLDCAAQETILEALIRQGFSYRADCGGRGTCGKCRLKVLEGSLEVTSQDAAVLSPEELNAGYRLACKAILQEGITIELSGLTEDRMLAVADHANAQYNTAPAKSQGSENKWNNIEDYCIAIDLGTTTLVVRLLESKSGACLGTRTCVNPQRGYGADVVSRIKASVEGKRKTLQQMIQLSLVKEIAGVLEAAGITGSMVKRIAIAGNTTMLHLLLGYSCETLGVYPFTPVKLRKTEISFEALFGGVEEVSQNILQGIEKTPVLLLPGVSAFVGGDIVAGLAVCGFHSSDAIALLIDLGTNGELALGNRNKLLVASTAAGPAFEGGNISCGVGSIPGAISHVALSDQDPLYKTIGDEVPVGLCGTGLIELVSELYRTEGMDSTGLLCEEYFQSGYPIKRDGKVFCTLLQKDIRELQLAKAAIRAGIEILLLRYGITAELIDRVYLAGGFGFYLDMEKAIRIGLLPEQWIGKIFTIGNSSLAGAERVATSPEFVKKLEHIITKAEEIHLSKEEEFNDLYLKFMSF